MPESFACVIFGTTPAGSALAAVPPLRFTLCRANLNGTLTIGREPGLIENLRPGRALSLPLMMST